MNAARPISILFAGAIAIGGVAHARCFPPYTEAGFTGEYPCASV